MRKPLSARPVPPGPPFDAPAARRLRAALGMGPEHVAYGMRASFGLPYVTPDLVMAWERGLASPSGSEVTALAAVLWCSPGELAGRPRTLREHRIARGLAPEDVAGTVGLELLAYLHMEEHDAWRGTDRQSAALAGLLELSLADFIGVTGRAGKLADLLHRAVTMRWQACVRPVSRIVPLDRRVLTAALHGLHQEYQRQGGDGRDFLDRIVEHFWSRVEDSPQDL
ncbi:XRE family transcriptional regulator [Streptomyces sp. NPDC001843]|uniref:XRE family transcriptional regulator n=1 Tax=Streptomyces sp. NPDC001843 TaxID=3364617 RepID=UPI003699131B